eukprot:UN29568
MAANYSFRRKLTVCTSVENESVMTRKNITLALHREVVDLYKKCKITEFLKPFHGGRANHGPNVKKLILLFNNIATYVKFFILQAKSFNERVGMIMEMIWIADELCTGLHNYHMASSMIIPLSCGVIDKLRGHWKKIRKLDRKCSIRYERMRRIFETAGQYQNLKDYQKYRAGIPWLGLLTQEVDQYYSLFPKVGRQEGLDTLRYPKLVKFLTKLEDVQKIINDPEFEKLQWKVKDTHLVSPCSTSTTPPFTGSSELLDQDIQKTLELLRMEFKNAADCQHELRQKSDLALEQDMEYRGSRSTFSAPLRAKSFATLSIIDDIINIVLCILLWDYFWFWLALFICVTHRVLCLYVIYYTDYNWQDSNRISKFDIFRDRADLLEPGDAFTLIGKVGKIVQCLLGIRLCVASCRIQTSGQLDEQIFDASHSWNYEFSRLHTMQVYVQSLPMSIVKIYFLSTYKFNAIYVLFVISTTIGGLNILLRSRQMIRMTQRSLFYSTTN